jgi:hypothetical protein
VGIGQRFNLSRTAWAALVLCTLAAVILAPSFILGPGPTHSQAFNYVWTSQIGDAMGRGELYPRWLPDSFEGLGSPAFYFYPPLTFWIAGGLDALGLTTLRAINLTQLLALLGSGAAMYAWLRYRGTRPLLGAALYMVAPYHTLDLYWRGAMAEYMAFIWFPLIALGIEALPKRWAPPLLTISVAGLAITHLPMLVLVVVFLAAPLAIRKVAANRNALLPGLVAALIGLGIAALYLIPALTLLDQVNSDQLWAPYFNHHFWDIWRWRDITDFKRALVCIALIAMLAAIRSKSIWTWLALAIGLAAFGLLPVWDLPGLFQVQFPWRVLGLMEFVAITALVSRPPQRVVLALMLALAIYPISTVAIIALTSPSQDDPKAYAELRRTMPDASEYLPRGLRFRTRILSEYPANLAPFRYMPRAQQRIVVTRAGQVVVHRAAFPIWRITRDGRTIPSRGPLITFAAEPGVYHLEWQRLWQERVGGWISLASLALLALISARAVLARPAARRPSQ